MNVSMNGNARTVLAAALAVVTLSLVTTANAAPSCTEWKKTGEFWFMRCVDDKKKPICFTCKTKSMSGNCKTQEGNACFR